jgi:hypothetical protein
VSNQGFVIEIQAYLPQIVEITKRHLILYRKILYIPPGLGKVITIRIVIVNNGIVHYG